MPSMNAFAELTMFRTQLTSDKCDVGLIPNFYSFVTYDILLSPLYESWELLWYTCITLRCHDLNLQITMINHTTKRILSMKYLHFSEIACEIKMKKVKAKWSKNLDIRLKKLATHLFKVHVLSCKLVCWFAIVRN